MQSWSCSLSWPAPGCSPAIPTATSLRVADVPAAYRRIFPPCVEPIADVLRELATSHGLAVLGGSHYRRAADGTYRNTALLAHTDGRVERQDKLHLTPQEQAMGTTPGDDVLVTGSVRPPSPSRSAPTSSSRRSAGTWPSTASTWSSARR